jgi:hypothetical protein
MLRVTAHAVTVFRIVAVIATGSAMFACDRAANELGAHERHPDTTSNPARHRIPSKPLRGLDDALPTSATPLVNGGAYLSALSGGTWYLKDSIAERVRVIGTVADSEAFASSFDLDVTPLLDGGAYAFSLPGRGVWLLRGAHAWRVTEGSVPQQARDTAKGAPFYTLYIHELQRRRALIRHQQDDEDSKLNDAAGEDAPDSP